jgi:uncharacterized membrane protein YcaP (DUF421 family)
MDILYFLGAAFVFAPFMLFGLTVLAARKKLGRKSIGLAADATTFLLFVSIPVAAAAIWPYNMAAITYTAAVVIAIFMLTVEWIKSKEIEVAKFLRKTWRTYFLILSAAHVLLWIGGIALSVNRFFIS